MARNRGTRERRRGFWLIVFWADVVLGVLVMSAVAVALTAAREQPAPAATHGPTSSHAPLVPTTATTEPWTATEAPTTTTAAVATPAGQPACHPSYQGTCIPPSVRDADCYGNGEDGPWYVKEHDVRVVGPDVYGLDVDYDGLACESQPGMAPGH
jgi:hypothetical protein